MRNRLVASTAVCAAFLALPGVGHAADSDCPGANDTPDQLSADDYAASLMCVVNETRRESGRGDLQPQRNLERAAGWHAADMVAEAYFSHTSPDGETLGDRLDGANFFPSSDRWRAGENLAAGHADGATPAAIVSGWMQSPEHRVNVLDSGFTAAGIGAARGWPGSAVSQSDSMTIAMDYGWRTFSRR